MAVNPNTMSNAEYAEYAQRMAQPVGPQPQQSGWLQQLAADIVSGAGLPMAQRGIPQLAMQPISFGGAGIPVQQNGVPALAAQPVAAGPVGMQPSMVPAYQASGAHYSPAGAREGWQEWGIPPIMMQRDPYATATVRAFTDEYGQMGVQPLVGFPSRYPHVLSGVPNSPLAVMGFLNQLMPQMGFIPFMGMGGMMPQMPQTPQAPRARGNGGGTAPSKTAGTPPATPPAAPPSMGGPYDETVWRNKTIPRQAAASQPVQQPVVQPQPVIDYPWLHYNELGDTSPTQATPTVPMQPQPIVDDAELRQWVRDQSQQHYAPTVPVQPQPQGGASGYDWWTDMLTPPVQPVPPVVPAPRAPAMWDTVG